MNKNELINYYTALFIKAYDGLYLAILSDLTEEDCKKLLKKLENHLSDEKIE